MTDAPHTGGSGEEGSALIEAIVSSVILLLAVVSLFVALDGQTAASGQARASSSATDLAEADQERLRSFRVPDLANKHEVRNVVLGGDSFVVDSKADALSDASGGTPSCANSSKQADYLRITSTVTTKRSRAPVVIRSLVAPPTGKYGVGQGTVAVKVVGGKGQAIEGATTTIASTAKTVSDATNVVGCAVFSYVPVGAYAVGVSAPGFVDPAGNLSATGSATATEATTNLTTVSYDRSGSIDVSFDTRWGTEAPVPSTGTVLSAANPGVPGTGFRLFRPGSQAATIGATNLFPFSDAYALYSGACVAANPTQYTPNYFVTYPNAGSVTVTSATNQAVTVREPALRLRLKAPAGKPVTVKATPKGTGCPDTFTWTLTPGTTLTRLPDPGVPFGAYDVCVQGNALSRTFANMAVTDPAGSAQQDVDLTTSSGNSGSACP